VRYKRGGGRHMPTPFQIFYTIGCTKR
jgi:hypothetical protein